MSKSITVTVTIVGKAQDSGWPVGVAWRLKLVHFAWGVQLIESLSRGGHLIMRVCLKTQLTQRKQTEKEARRQARVKWDKWEKKTDWLRHTCLIESVTSWIQPLMSEPKPPGDTRQRILFLNERIWFCVSCSGKYLRWYTLPYALTYPDLTFPTAFTGCSVGCELPEEEICLIHLNNPKTDVS